MRRVDCHIKKAEKARAENAVTVTQSAVQDSVLGFIHTQIRTGTSSDYVRRNTLIKNYSRYCQKLMVGFHPYELNAEMDKKFPRPSGAPTKSSDRVVRVPHPEILGKTTVIKGWKGVKLLPIPDESMSLEEQTKF